VRADPQLSKEREEKKSAYTTNTRITQHRIQDRKNPAHSTHGGIIRKASLWRSYMRIQVFILSGFGFDLFCGHVFVVVDTTLHGFGTTWAFETGPKLSEGVRSVSCSRPAGGWFVVLFHQLTHNYGFPEAWPWLWT